MMNGIIKDKFKMAKDIDNYLNEKSGYKTTYRCLLWGNGNAFLEYYNLIKNLELTGQICVCGITSNDLMYSEMGGYPVLDKESIRNDDYDIVIIMAKSKTIVNDINIEALSKGIDETKIVPCHTLSLIGFDFNKYMMLKQNTPTIFAPNCWGGITYHTLGLRFASPFINMFENHNDYIKFLMNSQHYINCELRLREMKWETILKRDYPVVECDDILLNFNHYISFEEANEAWVRRKRRINWDNVFVMFYDEDPGLVEKFLEIPYGKKKCFVPYGSRQKDVISVEYRNNDQAKKIPFWQVVNAMASGRFMYYNVFDLLLYNKFTPIAALKECSVL